VPERFRVRLERPEGLSRGANFRVPQHVMKAFAPRSRVPVVVTINDYSWRTTIAPYGGEFYVPVRSEICSAIGADAGETVEVAVERDAAERSVEVPADLARALDAAGVRSAFDRLSYSLQKECAQSVATAKRPETRQRRIDAAVSKLSARPAKKGR